MIQSAGHPEPQSFGETERVRLTMNTSGCESPSTGAVTAAALATITLISIAPVLATDLSSPMSASPNPVPWLLGDWNGARTQLKNGGLDFQLSYIGEVAGNLSGGVRRQAAYADQWAAGVAIDLGRLAVRQGGSLHVTITDRNGTNLSNDAGLGTLEEVEEIYGRGQSARLTRFYYNQIFADRLVEWKIGRIPFSEDFAAFACDFQNLTFCGAAAGNIVSNYVYNWPISQWASRWKLALTDSGYFQFAVFDQNPKYLGLQQALLPAYFAGSTGVLLPAEFAWLPKFGVLQEVTSSAAGTTPRWRLTSLIPAAEVRRRSLDHRSCKVAAATVPTLISSKRSRAIQHPVAA